MTKEWTGFKLVADDLLFFRDGRPAAIGQDHFHRSMFPPAPSTLYGAIRARRLIDFGVDVGKQLDEAAWNGLPQELRDEVGEWGQLGSLELRGPWIVRSGEVLFPAPADVGVSLRSGCEPAELAYPWHAIEDVYRLRFESQHGVVNGWSHGLRCGRYCRLDAAGVWSEVTDADIERAEGWFLTEAGIDTWQRGLAPDSNAFCHSSELWSDEPRTGVGLDRKLRHHEEHMLFTFGFIRLQSGVAIGFEARGTDLEPSAAFRLGGEGRTVRVETGPGLPAFPDVVATGELAISFVTPAVSSGGVYPPGFSQGSPAGTLDGSHATLVAAAARAGLTIGGWDMALGRAKPQRRTIASGAVYIFEGESDLAARLHGQSLGDVENGSYARQGFGVAIAGLVR